MDELRTVGTVLEKVQNPEIVFVVGFAMWLTYRFLVFAFRYVVDSFGVFLKSIPDAIKKQTEATEKATETSDKTSRAVVTAFEVMTKQVTDRLQSSMTIQQNQTFALEALSGDVKRQTSTITDTTTQTHTLLGEMRGDLASIKSMMTAHDESAVSRANTHTAELSEVRTRLEHVETNLNRLSDMLKTNQPEPSESPEPPPAETNPEPAETSAQAGDVAPVS
jgi:flagellar biosynthesis regulator FlaF